MGDKRDVWRFANSNEYEYKYPGKYGAKGEKREKKKKATPEQIKKQNQANRENRVRRLIKANFGEGDLWCTLKYPEGTRKSAEEVIKKDLKNFFNNMRKRYKRHGVPFRYVYRVEVGERGGIHIHVIINRIREKADTDLMIQKVWKHGRVNFESIYEAGGFKRLANYIVKEPDEETWEQLSLFPEEERKSLIKYSSSRNLVRPQPEREEYTRETMRKLIEEGPKPTKGYYIDRDSIVCGKNQYTGYSYLKYTEIRLESRNCREEEEKDAGRRNLYRHKHKGTGARKRKGHVPDARRPAKRTDQRE